MEQETNGRLPKVRGKGGRPPKAAQEKASEPVGPYRLTPSEKQQYEKLVKASGLNNQARFFRQAIFSKSLKLYYSDENLKRIYAKLVEIQSDLRRIGVNYNQAVKALNTVHEDDINAGEQAALLVELTKQISEEFKEIIALFREYEKISKDKRLDNHFQ